MNELTPKQLFKDVSPYLIGLAELCKQGKEINDVVGASVRNNLCTFEGSSVINDVVIFKFEFKYGSCSITVFDKQVKSIKFELSRSLDFITLLALRGTIMILGEGYDCDYSSYESDTKVGSIRIKNVGGNEFTKVMPMSLYNKNIITDRLRSICEYIKANSDRAKEDETNFDELSDDTFRVVFYYGVNLVRIIDHYYDSISCDLDVTDIRITSRYNIRNFTYGSDVFNLLKIVKRIPKSTKEEK